MNRTILLTGVTGSFGKIFLCHLLTLGHTVIGTASTQASLNKIEKEFDLQNKKFFGVVVDLCEVSSTEKIIDILHEKNLHPDCLINGARSLKFLEVDQSGLTSRDNFLNEYLLDVVIPYELSMRLHNYTKSLKLILNIGSQYGVVAANPNLYQNSKLESPIQYGVAKAALSHLTKELAVRLVEHRVQVNCIAYGGLEGRTNDSF